MAYRGTFIWRTNHDAPIPTKFWSLGSKFCGNQVETIALQLDISSLPTLSSHHCMTSPCELGPCNVNLLSCCPSCELGWVCNVLILVRIQVVGKSLCIGSQNLNLGSARDPIQTLNDPLRDQYRYHDLPLSSSAVASDFRFLQKQVIMRGVIRFLNSQLTMFLCYGLFPHNLRGPCQYHVRH